MKENPYSKLIEIMKSQNKNSPSLMLAEVISPNPLTIGVGELQLDGENLIVADYLLDDYKRSIRIPTSSASGSTTNGSISSIGIPETEITFLDGLLPGDLLAVYPITDNQIYVILSRVVKV